MPPRVPRNVSSISSSLALHFDPDQAVPEELETHPGCGGRGNCRMAAEDGVDQPSQRISGSLRGTDGGQILGFPTMIGATGTHCPGIPRTDFPLGVLR